MQLTLSNVKLMRQMSCRVEYCTNVVMAGRSWELLWAIAALQSSPLLMISLVYLFLNSLLIQAYQFYATPSLFPIEVWEEAIDWIEETYNYSSGSSPISVDPLLCNAMLCNSMAPEYYQFCQSEPKVANMQLTLSNVELMRQMRCRAEYTTPVVIVERSWELRWAVAALQSSSLPMIRLIRLFRNSPLV